MKETLQADKTTLSVNGRERGLESKDSQINQEVMTVIETPTEGVWFKVNPLVINQNLFKEKRRDVKQEKTRLLILEAFEEMKKNCKYAKSFEIMAPRKIWETKTIKELKEFASKWGDHNADWVEWAFMLAQRIANGETWEAICNEPDTSNWYRLVVWKHGYARFVGGSSKCNCNFQASDVILSDLEDNDNLRSTVPLIVIYK